MQATIWTILCTTYGAWLGKSEIVTAINESSEIFLTSGKSLMPNREKIEYASVTQLEE